MIKYTIPIMLIATVMVAGIFAFMPVEQARTVHTTIIAATAGYDCVTDTVTVPAVTIDNDQLTFTFSGEGAPIYITSLSAAVTTGGAADESFGIQAAQDGDATQITDVDGADLTLVIDDNAADTPDDTEREILGVATLDYGIFVETTLDLIVDDDEGATDLDTGDIITFEICGLVSDPANFTNADVAIAFTAGT